MPQRSEALSLACCVCVVLLSRKEEENRIKIFRRSVMRKANREVLWGRKTALSKKQSSWKEKRIFRFKNASQYVKTRDCASLKVHLNRYSVSKKNILARLRTRTGTNFFARYLFVGNSALLIFTSVLLLLKCRFRSD